MKYSMQTIVSIINDNTPDNIEAIIKNCWKDYGAGTSWNTIVIRNTSRDEDDVLSSYQALTPRDYDDIINCKFTLDKIEELIDTAKRLMK